MLNALPDLQSGTPTPELQIHLSRVGVEHIKFPIRVLRKGLTQPTGDATSDVSVVDVQATVAMFSDVPAKHRGTHMSRFLEILMQHQFERISITHLPVILQELRDRLGSEEVSVRIEFDYFYPITTPITGLPCVDDVHCELSGVLNSSGVKCYQGILLVGTNCCPCSKEISERGAHNQRVDLHVRFAVDQGSPNILWFEDVAEDLKKCVSSPIFPLLKRPDEKYVTELAYDNPKFSEDVAREAAQLLRDNYGLKEWWVRASAHESIHHHNASSIAKSDLWEYPW